MKVLVVSEGQHEQAGALENILRKLGGKHAVFDSKRVADKSIHAIHGKGQGYYKRALCWIREAEKKGYDAVIFLIDEDGIKKISNTSSGVNIIYTYMGPITLVDNFKKAFQEVFGLINDIYKVFKKANNPLLLIGAELEEFKGFNN